MLSRILSPQDEKSSPCHSVRPAPLGRSLFRTGFRTGWLVVCSAVLCGGALAQTSSYLQTTILSDGSVPAAQTDPTLLNPWGVSIGQGSLWIDTAGSGFSLVDSIAGVKSFAVAVPPAASTSAHGSPAGTVFNGNSAIFNIPKSTSALFLFGTLDGTIAAWNANTPEAVTVVNNSSAHAAYTDIALDTNATGTFLLAADFSLGTVDVFDSTFAPAHLAGSFADPQLPAGFAPFGIHSIGTKIYVTYAQPDPTTGREMVGAGLGYVDVFDVNGNLLQRAISQGVLNAPWGMALAPAGFGSFGGDLLIGNFGDGVINAFDPNTFAMVGQLQNAAGAAITNTGLWEIFFGQSGAGDPNTLYFAAGINGEKDGLFGSLAVAAPATTSGSFTVAASAPSLSVTNGKTGTMTLSLTASNGFSGPVTFSCSGLPAGDSCAFSPATVTLSGTAASSVAVSIATAAAATPVTTTPYSVGSNKSYSGSGSGRGNGRGMTLAFLGPLGLFGLVGLRRRSAAVRGIMLMLVLGVVSMAAVGCSGSNAAPPAAAQTPAPVTQTPTATPTTSQVTINAISGTVTQSVTVALTVM
jgi:uncharacterized protein (TIGR03118 family)